MLTCIDKSYLGKTIFVIVTISLFILIGFFIADYPIVFLIIILLLISILVFVFPVFAIYLVLITALLSGTPGIENYISSIRAVSIIGFVAIMRIVFDIVRFKGSIDNKILFKPYIFWWIIFLFWGFISVIWSPNRLAWVSGIYSFLSMTSLVIIVTTQLKTTKSIQQLIFFISIFAMVSSGMAILSGLRVFGPIDVNSRLAITGGLENPNYLAGCLALITPFTLGLIKNQTRLISKILASIILMVMIVGSIITLSRGGLISLSIGIGTFILINLVYEKNKKNFALAILPIVLVYLSYEISIRFFNFDLLSRFNEAILEVTRGQSVRAMLMKIAWLTTLNHPILGLGLGNFISDFPSLSSEYHILQYSNSPIAVHNAYLSVSSELGFVGLFLFIIALFSTLKELAKIHKKKAINGFIFVDSIFAAFLAGLSLGVFNELNQNKYFWFVIGLIIVFGIRSDEIHGSMIKEVD